jgi:hypothetical protein
MPMAPSPPYIILEENYFPNPGVYGILKQTTPCNLTERCYLTHIKISAGFGVIRKLWIKG